MSKEPLSVQMRDWNRLNMPSDAGDTARSGASSGTLGIGGVLFFRKDCDELSAALEGK